ncbi:MAG: 1,4-dihydroxy-2-naphthoate octaprenyltransferase [Deltaproteobacteria bacterium]|nr:1,4-dihydroxy-2-naphthoate octaprenyltransferase [Deltaproteobacteria bacterium]
MEEERKPALCLWLVAIRPKTLLISASPVLVSGAFAWFHGIFQAIPWFLCLVFAVLCQTAANLANDYFDFLSGVDANNRSRAEAEKLLIRGVLTPCAMRNAAVLVLGVALLVGLALVFYGGWWLAVVGALVAAAVLGYSGGPWPLASHGLGEVVTVLFYGLVPTVLTFYVQGGAMPPWEVWLAAIAVGLVAANVMMVNNYRDVEADRSSGKRTLAVRFGRRAIAWAYLGDAVCAWFCGCLAVHRMALWSLAALPFAVLSLWLWRQLTLREGRELNRILALSSANTLGFSLTLIVVLMIEKVF